MHIHYLLSSRPWVMQQSQIVLFRPITGWLDVGHPLFEMMKPRNQHLWHVTHPNLCQHLKNSCYITITLNDELLLEHIISSSFIIAQEFIFCQCVLLLFVCWSSENSILLQRLIVRWPLTWALFGGSIQDDVRDPCKKASFQGTWYLWWNLVFLCLLHGMLFFLGWVILTQACVWARWCIGV